MGTIFPTRFQCDNVPRKSDVAKYTMGLFFKLVIMQDELQQTLQRHHLTAQVIRNTTPCNAMPKIGWECVCRSCHFTECTCILKRNPKSTLSKLVYLCTAGSFFLTCPGKKYICSNPHGSPEGWARLPLVVYVFRYFLLQLLRRDDSTAY